MAQTTDLFVQTPVIHIECKRGEVVPFEAKFFEGKDIHKIYKAEPAGCPCTRDFMFYHNRVVGKYHDGYTAQDFKDKGDPLFIQEERQFTIWYHKEGVPTEVINERGISVTNVQLPWESVTLKIKINNK